MANIATQAAARVWARIVRTSSLPNASRVPGSGSWEGPNPSGPINAFGEPLVSRSAYTGPAYAEPYRPPPNFRPNQGVGRIATYALMAATRSAFAERHRGYSATLYNVSSPQVYAKPTAPTPGKAAVSRYALQTTVGGERG